MFSLNHECSKFPSQPSIICLYLILITQKHVSVLHAISPFFLGFHQGNRFKISKMYEALTAMVFNQLLWEFAHIFLHPKLMPVASISQFDGRLVNQQRRINECGFRLFDSSKYLTTLRSNISPCQKATTLILIPLYNPSFHLWKSSKKSLGTTVFLSWMPFKICDCDKFLSTTLVTQFLL